MKLTEKKDLILKVLYDFKFDGERYSLAEIFANNKVEIISNELYAIGLDLKRNGYIRINGGEADFFAEITSKGVEYCEKASFSNNEIAIINNNFNISNSENTNIVTNSDKVFINSEINILIEKIYEIEKLVKENIKTNPEFLNLFEEKINLIFKLIKK